MTGRPDHRPGNYRLAVLGPANRRISEDLPESVAGAVALFITGDLLVNPQRVGKELIGPLAGTWSARRGSYRVLYEIDEESRVVIVVDIDHQAAVYRRGRPRRRS